MVGQGKGRQLSYSRAAFIYLFPAFLLMVVFVFYPIVNTIITSCKEEYRFLTGDFLRFSLQNYTKIISDPIFHRSFFNTVFIAFVCVPVSMISALAIALALHSLTKLRNFLVTLFYLPQVTNIIAAGMVFALMFNNNFGLVNVALGAFGIEPVAWISGVGIAGSAELYHAAYGRCLFVLFTYQLWQGLPLKVILFLGGLQNISPQYYQAAQLDGSSRWNVFRKITLPLLSPTMIYVFITSSITAFKAYSAVVALFGNSYGPAGDNSKMMITIVGYIMDSLGDYLKPGAVSMAGAAAVILMLIIMVFTRLQMKVTNRWVYYQ